ncbi:MAG: FKBP-type peptidyl-prolyl cis-trans isomerase [Treponema sp.]|jgi:FKBP-type peptidyl-prolyl cis-trans isomerase|nr:FKBP-type peptidyl-prolyl cis-trans isomerase [Treponema sp.]
MKIKTVLHVFPGIPAIIVCLFLLGGCNKTANDPNSFTFNKDASYALGMYIASQFQIPDVHYDYQSFMEGFRAYNEMLESRFSMEEAINKINDAFISYENWYMGAYMPDPYMQDTYTWSAEDLEINRQDGIQVLAENAMRPEVNVLPSGLQYEVIEEGNGIRPAASDIVRVNYEGMLIDGTVFDSSYARGEPAQFALRDVIRGWTEGLQLMSEGSTYILFIPYELGYGPTTTGSIPGYSTLIFLVELLSIVR